MTRMVKSFYFRVMILIVLYTANALFGDEGSFQSSLETVSITYWVAIGYLAYFGLYVLTLKCNDCGEPVIYKSVNPSGWQLPTNCCSECGKGFD
ncbi:hypothetical protein AHAT_39250 [Agarivorans sp. Toyoura001]|nr:hypothetical protein AHAT_39250 [Agarivorans sp. Toyoura001]